MKTSLVIILTLFSLGAQATETPYPTTTPLYFCNNESIQAHIFRNEEGQTAILINGEEELVSELTNKTLTVYTSDHITLKITHDESGFMPSTLVFTKDGSATQSNLTCQFMYKFKDDASAAH